VPAILSSETLQYAAAHLLAAPRQGSKRSILVISGNRRRGAARNYAGGADGRARDLAPSKSGLVGIHKFRRSRSPRKRYALAARQANVAPHVAMPVAEFVNESELYPCHLFFRTSSHSF
jgi:hypothetical protein